MDVANIATCDGTSGEKQQVLGVITVRFKVGGLIVSTMPRGDGTDGIRFKIRGLLLDCRLQTPGSP